VDEFNKSDTPFIIVHSKSDIEPIKNELKVSLLEKYHLGKIIETSIGDRSCIEVLISSIQEAIPESSYKTPTLLGDLISYGDIVLLITPIDVEAPAGRLILPQVQAIRDVLDNDAVAIVLKEREVDVFLRKTKVRPALVVTDSQVFVKADASIPKEIPLTSFSILLARFKGDFENYIKGTPKISDLQDGDRVLLLESCTHHVSCDDIGRVNPSVD
jgi:[FeFe] hydrogenase H-cluster maturation GTPase HydF